ncbi:MAG: NfeD family protein [Acidimicrobiales bacterium]|nr:NfeD family protein [Hyphomonadaceae bacterium]RZV41588.1 MAG: NfeD family protein [Acidimicrobiales bacterium]
MNADPNIIMQFLEGMNGTRWLFLFFGLLIIEVLTGTTYILWPALAAVIVALCAFILPIGWSMQLVLFFILSAVFLYLGHTKLKPMMKGGEPSDLNDRARSMQGMRVKAIADFDTGRGRVQVGDTQWRASMETGDAKAGQELRVVTVKGTTLVVEPI